jgi:hypothetical protein
MLLRFLLTFTASRRRASRLRAFVSFLGAFPEGYDRGWKTLVNILALILRVPGMNLFAILALIAGREPCRERVGGLLIVLSLLPT